MNRTYIKVRKMTDWIVPCRFVFELFIVIVYITPDNFVNFVKTTNSRHTLQLIYIVAALQFSNNHVSDVIKAISELIPRHRYYWEDGVEMNDRRSIIFYFRLFFSRFYQNTLQTWMDSTISNILYASSIILDLDV